MKMLKEAPFISEYLQKRNGHTSMKNNEPLFVNSIDSLLKHLNLKTNKQQVLIGIDGRPGSGKTTLAMDLEKKIPVVAPRAMAGHRNAIYLDEFFIPQQQWPKDQNPRFPFFYFRYQEFLDGIKALAAGKPFAYYT